MIIELKREIFNANNTIGSIIINNNVYYTLEDTVRFPEGSTLEFIKANKIHGKTAIPYGTYKIAWTYSNRFERFMPELLNVPGFAGIRIHVGNYADQIDYYKSIKKTKSVKLTPPIYVEIYE